MSVSVEHFQSTLGSVGLKVSVSSVLDMADPLYPKVPEEIRAAAWISAQKSGWTESGVKMIVKNLMGQRYDEDTANIVIGSLKEAARKYPDIIVDN